MARPTRTGFEVALTYTAAPQRQRCYGSFFDWQVQNCDAHDVSCYVEVHDPTAYRKKTDQPGGQTIVGPTEIPQCGLPLAFFADPEAHTSRAL